MMNIMKKKLRNYSNTSVILVRVRRAMMIMQDRMLTMYQLPLCGDPIGWSNSLDVTIHWQVETASTLSDPLTCWSTLRHRMMGTSV